MSRVFLFLALSTLVFSAKRKVDERGNVISSESAAPSASTAGGLPVPVPVPVVAESGATPEEKPAAPTAEASGDEEEALARANLRNPLTKVYFENAQLYLRSERSDKALEFLRKSIEAGEDEFSREAKLQALFLRGRRGDANLEAEADGFDDKLKSTALMRIADGYYACSRELTKKPECGAEAERIYAYVGELAPRSSDGKLARIRLGLLLVDAGRYEAALPHLTATLMNEESAKSGETMRQIPWDRAWFNLGQLYERPWYHRDTHKAHTAYKQLLKYPQSPYHRAARDRLAHLERFGLGYARP